MTDHLKFYKNHRPSPSVTLWFCDCSQISVCSDEQTDI